ncbi:Esterase [Nesidiocoris tenuis]|uniref:Carboxylic ester hydrolase n=1 Tax=Nesidiocoris tenuis TaxID=355587 RepID=A0ABN7B678_9HEMI|nr:Esterase [Nesidiocoris tenuis]
MAGITVILCALAFTASTFGQKIHTRLGDLEGRVRTSRDGREYTAWSKIPYAKPPVGPLRLANPEPFGKWTGVLKATEDLPACVQTKFGKLGRPSAGQEDCLYLSVYKPNIEASALPVVFYVHGGAFLLGHPGPENLADYLMDENVILVTITYRLGTLGFLSLIDKELPGNFGLKDQAMALRWVYDNIADFGGNPELITVFGESAGGASAHYLLLSPATRDIVSKAYAMSGTVQKAWSVLSPSTTKTTSETMIGTLGCKKESIKETLECLRAIEDPLAIADALDAIDDGDLDTLKVGPTIEPAGPGAFAAEDLSEAVSNKPLILSFAAGEYLLFVIPELLAKTGRAQRVKDDLDGYARRVLREAWNDEKQLASAAKLLKDHYLKSDNLDLLLQETAMIQQDLGFVHPALEVAESHQGPKWLYQMVHRGEASIFDMFFKLDTKVAAHADDMLYLLNHREKFRASNATMNEVDERISKQMVKFLVNFATYGNPTPDGSPLFWKQYNGDEILRVKTEGFEMADDEFIKEQKSILNLWRRLLNMKSEKDEL